jgi:octaprenyl-diphosphate synthase
MIMSTLLSPILAPQMQALELRLREVVRSKVEFIEAIGENLVTAGGKRFRPALVFLSAKALGLHDPREVDLAIAVELLHSATLLHDDLIDDAETRRGKEAAFRRYGNAVSVLSGDFMLSRVLKLLSTMPPCLTAEFAETSMHICEGEVLQFQIASYGDYNLANYLEVITAKTAVLLATAVRAPALLMGIEDESDPRLMALTTYGLEYGRAFQIQDDLLDLMSDPLTLGKPIGGDLREGKVTLPVLHLLEGENATEVRTIVERRAEKEGDVQRVRDLVQNSSALELCLSELRSRSNLAVQALKVLPASPARQALEDLALSAAQRVL